MLRFRVPKIILVFFLCDLALGLAYFFNYLLDHPIRMLNIFLDLNRENNLPTWYSSINWFCVATLLGIFAHRNFSYSRRNSWPLIILPLIFLAFSLDEIAQIHEQLGALSDKLLPDSSRRNTMFYRTGIWMFLIGLPFIASFVALIYSIRYYFKSSPGSLFKICFGMVIMLTGAIGIETLSNFVDRGSIYFMLQVFSEELFEMLGGTIVLWGTYDLLLRHNFFYRLDKVEHG